LRELVIIRIGYLTRVTYIIDQHVPNLALPEGLSLAECEALKDWRDSAFFGERERTALAYADSMTQDIQVPEAVFAAILPHFDERGIVELTVLIGTYNMHARVMHALEIDSEPVSA
jgi:alkylhydroperoxidase family enzyme